MTRAVVLRLAVGHRETDRGAERDPVGVLARNVAAIDQIDRKNLVRPVTHAGLNRGWTTLGVSDWPAWPKASMVHCKVSVNFQSKLIP